MTVKFGKNVRRAESRSRLALQGPHPNLPGPAAYWGLTGESFSKGGGSQGAGLRPPGRRCQTRLASCSSVCGRSQGGPLRGAAWGASCAVAPLRQVGGWRRPQPNFTPRSSGCAERRPPRLRCSQAPAASATHTCCTGFTYGTKAISWPSN